MAKQPVGPVIRHLEKGILLVCGGAFLYFVAMYGVLTPNKAGDATQGQYGPAEIDEQIRAEAERLRDKLLNAEPPPPSDEHAKFEPPNLSELQDPIAVAKVDLTISTPVAPGVEVPDTGGKEAEKVAIVEPLQMGKPRLLQGRSGLYLVPADEFKAQPSVNFTDETYLADVNWVTVWAPFDRDRQEQLCSEAKYGNVTKTVFLGVDVQRRMLQPTGTWTDWEAIPSYSLTADPPYPKPRVYRAGGGFNVSDEDRAIVTEFIDLITDGDNNEAQVQLMRPLFPGVKYGDPWTYPKGDLDVLAMDAEYQINRNCRYAECSSDRAAPGDDKDFDELMEEAEEALRNNQLEVALKVAESARNKASTSSTGGGGTGTGGGGGGGRGAGPPIGGPGGPRGGPPRGPRGGNPPGGGRTTTTGNQRDIAEADKLIDRIKQALELSGRAVPDRLPTQVLWAHDAGTGSLLSGRTYQYRIRPRLFNRFCGTPTLLQDPQRAADVELVGPWSEPSDPVSIEPDTAIFVKNDTPAKQEIKVEVFKWEQGEWFQRAFSVKVGDRIGEPKSVSLEDGERKTIDFDTGAVVVDIDFRRSATLPGRRNKRLETVDTAALVYVDASGQLHEHLLYYDKNSKAYDAMRGLVKD